MKKHITLIAISVLVITVATCMNQSNTHTKKSGFAIIDVRGNPTPPLLELLTILQVNHNGSLQNIVDETQKQWLRAAGKERWQVDEILSTHKEQLMPLFKTLGMYNEITPAKKQYDYLILLGATAGRMWTRLAYAVELWKQGVRFNHIVLLGSERPLDPAIEAYATICGSHDATLPKRTDVQPSLETPKNEAQAFSFIYNVIALPQEMRVVPMTLINSPMRTNPNGTQRRATTGDTIHDWLALNPAPGNCLLISNQPYVWYQDSVGKTFLTQPWDIETAGQGASENVRIVEMLDTLARTLYQENIRLNGTTQK